MQEEGISARTAFVGPFQEGLHRGQEAQDRRWEHSTTQGWHTTTHSFGAAGGSGGMTQVQLCVWGEEGSLNIFWDRLSFLCRTSQRSYHHVTKVDRVQQSAKTRIRFDIWVTRVFAETLMGKMGPGRDRYGWYFRPHIPYWDRVRSTSALPEVPVVQTPSSRYIRGPIGHRDL